MRVPATPHDHRFPIYKPGDIDAKATGGERQICHKFKTGDTSWILRPSRVLRFSGPSPRACHAREGRKEAPALTPLPLVVRPLLPAIQRLHLLSSAKVIDL